MVLGSKQICHPPFDGTQNHWGDEEELEQGVVSLYTHMGFRIGAARQGATRQQACCDSHKANKRSRAS